MSNQSGINTRKVQWRDSRAWALRLTFNEVSIDPDRDAIFPLLFCPLSNRSSSARGVALSHIQASGSTPRAHILRRNS
jgi:hypothetical protein